MHTANGSTVGEQHHENYMLIIMAIAGIIAGLQGIMQYQVSVKMSLPLALIFTPVRLVESRESHGCEFHCNRS
jgi:ABC-type uncharacterized transport system permease subunit